MDSRRDGTRDQSLGRSKERLGQARVRRARQKRVLGFVFFLVAVLVVGSIANAIFSQPTVAPPTLIVDWPKPKVSQTVASGTTVLLRQGQNFSVSISDAEKWDVAWTHNNDQTRGSQIQWAATENEARLTATCRPVVSGWRRVFAWLRPSQTLTLNGRRPTSLGGYRFKIAPPSGGVWIYPHIIARAPIVWDEQALPLLAEPVLPALKGTLRLSVPASVAPTKTSADNATPPADREMWQLVGGFDAKAKPDARDIGTYARLNSTALEDDMLRVTQLIAQNRPQVSLKFGVRLDVKPPHGVLRVAFDGKGARAGWIKRAGESGAGPIIWDDRAPDNPLAPASPSGVQRNTR